MKQLRIIAAVCAVAGLAAACATAGLAAEDQFLVDEGKAYAEIIISESPARSTRLAAAELQTYVAKISGARIPIRTEPSADVPVQIYVGESKHAAKLGVTADGLEHGAYRFASGENWLALIGDDSDFEPVHPFARNNGDKPRAQAEWEKIVGAPYGMPSRNLYKNRLRFPGETGKPDGAVTDKKETLEIWGLDERGSFNAVCGYLRKLGVRWYLPGELGEVIPEMDSIPLPQIDETVMPDFPLRQFNFRFSTAGYHTSMWAMRLGTRNDERYQVAHGMSGPHSTSLPNHNTKCLVGRRLVSSQMHMRRTVYFQSGLNPTRPLRARLTRSCCHE
jgi:hypothetical protein